MLIILREQTMSMGKRGNRQTPKATVVLVLIGGLLILFSGALAIVGIPTGVSFADGHLMIQTVQGISIYHGIIETISGVILVTAAIYINSKTLGRVQNWSVVAIVFSIISLIGGGGFLIGFILALMGSLLGIIYGYFIVNRPVYYVPRREISEERKPDQKATSTQISAKLTREEKKLYELVGQANGAIFQADLVEKSNFSKVKVSRILDKLEGRGLIERRRRGMTNIVILKNSEKASP